MKFYFTVDNIKLNFDSGSLRAIAEEAVKLKVGARGLKAVIEKVLQPYMFNMSAMKTNQVKSITITEKVIKENEEATLKYEIQKK